MEIYTKNGLVWAKGQGTPAQVMRFLNEAVENNYDMVDGEITGDIETYERD